MARFLAGYTDAEVRELALWVVDHELWPKRRAGLLEELDGLRRAGNRVLLVSATYEPVLAEFARRIGADAVGTPLEMKDGRATGRIVHGGANSGARKLRRLKAVRHDAELLVAYGDTAADVAMLESSLRPTAVHPDRALRRVASERGWRIIGPGKD